MKPVRPIHIFTYAFGIRFYHSLISQFGRNFNIVKMFLHSRLSHTLPLLPSKWNDSDADPKWSVLALGCRGEAETRQEGCSKWDGAAEGERNMRVGSDLLNTIIEHHHSLSDRPHFRAARLHGKRRQWCIICLEKSPSCFYSCLCHKQQQNLISSVNIQNQYGDGMNYL